MDDASYSHILSVFCSVYTTEAMEISYALKLISSSQYRKFCIYSDSMSVLQQLEHIESATHPILLNIADTVHCLKKKGFDIVFCWTPSHVGILGLEEWKSVETLMTNNNGGIIDILIVSKLSKDQLRIVANTPKVLTKVQNLLEGFEGDVSFKIADERYYFIFQGPECATFLEYFFLEVENLPSMCCKEYETMVVLFEYISALLTRNIDTEEDGYSMACEGGFSLIYDMQSAVDRPEMPLIGLEAKECLRIEAGKCLSGYDIDEDTTPVEAQLTHLISDRKKKEGGFPGSERILKQLRDGPSIIRRGFISKEGRLRRGDTVSSPTGQKIGFVTSGAYSPIAKEFIGMGYIDATYSTKNDEIVFNNTIKGKFHKFPFVNKGEPR
ncbi:Aminomethyltransferase, mitochondrial [Araneus ventricosus]|uniref:Aminomethyltransferase, mitochondrial n=1 Tax=Araneus ventricosus TaxID=182803 RepID=A0A4Y2M5M3_ARAVE|nr:Aminomethyltransferase, mitochondrial [Araneus ventricosus]GBN20976.1 Aminomethyltransferase, mitochondrial [Araneus ventricosus]